MKPIQPTDILTYNFLSGPRFAPGGARAAFAVSRANEEENNYESRLWLWENGALRQLTDLGKERQFAWLDEHRLIFPAVRSARERKRAEAKEEFTSFYVLDVRGGEALPLFTVPLRADGVRALDETHLLLSAIVDKRNPDFYCKTEEERAAVQEQRKEDADYEVFDELPFWLNGAGVTNGHRLCLFLVTLSPFSVKAITAPPEQLDGLTELGGEAYFLVSRIERRAARRGFALRALDWKTGAVRTVCEHETLCTQGLETLDGKLLLFANDGARHGLNENAWVYTVDPQTGELSVLRREQYSMYGSVGCDCRLGGGRQALSADGRLFHITTRGGSSHVYELLPDGSDVPVLTAEGSVDSFDAANGKLLLVGLYGMRLQELYEFDLASGGLTKVSAFNDAALEGKYVAQPQRLCVQSAGCEIEGWVLLPEDFSADRRYPAVLDIHGGPKTVSGPVFFHEMQVWAGMGYVVFFCNPKGSDGGDNAFMDIRGDYGGTDFRNLMDFTDAVLAACPQIDPARLCVTGGSYGGFMTNWILGHTDRFCCAASQRSIANWLSFWGTSDIGYLFAADQTGGSLYDSPEKLWAQSPLAYAKNAVTPTLFIHSDEDYRCPLSEGLQMYAALLDRGVEARLCLFHGENHELSRSGKPKHRLRRLKEITEWFERFTR